MLRRIAILTINAQRILLTFVILSTFLVAPAPLRWGIIGYSFFIAGVNYLIWQTYEI